MCLYTFFLYDFLFFFLLFGDYKATHAEATGLFLSSLSSPSSLYAYGGGSSGGGGGGGGSFLGGFGGGRFGSGGGGVAWLQNRSCTLARLVDKKKTAVDGNRRRRGC